MPKRALNSNLLDGLSKTSNSFAVSNKRRRYHNAVASSDIEYPSSNAKLKLKTEASVSTVSNGSEPEIEFVEMVNNTNTDSGDSGYSSPETGSFLKINQPKFLKTSTDKLGSSKHVKSEADKTHDEEYRRQPGHPRHSVTMPGVVSAELEELTRSIWYHHELNRQNEDVFSWKMSLRAELLQFLQNNYLPTCDLFVTGSSVNRLGSYNSDMDLCLVPEPTIANHFDSNREYAVAHLRRLRTLLRHYPRLRTMELVPAKVPILKIRFREPYTKLEVDLNCNNLAGVYNSHLLHYYGGLDDRFPPLALLIKHWAIKQDINEARFGTLNSYSLILMIIHYLQVGATPPVLPNLQQLFPGRFSRMASLDSLMLFQSLPAVPGSIPSLNQQSVGELLFGFFEYYSQVFDFDRDAISIARGCRFPRSALPPDTEAFYIFIEEPFDHQNTARCVTKPHNFDAISEAIEMAYDKLSVNPDVASLDVEI